MRDHPIIFSAPMVLALLAGRKTQTRRLAWRDPLPVPDDARDYWLARGAKVSGADDTDTRLAWMPSPWQRVKPGDRLWVRENWKPVPASAYRCSEGVQQTPNPGDPDEAAVYGAGWDRSTGGAPWRPSIHMPRWASRLTLSVTDVRVQRLQEISEADAEAEGFVSIGVDDPGRWFANLWNSLHGPDAWAANPEVVALTFTVAQRNIDHG